MDPSGNKNSKKGSRRQGDRDRERERQNNIRRLQQQLQAAESRRISGSTGTGSSRLADRLFRFSSNDDRTSSAMPLPEDAPSSMGRSSLDMMWNRLGMEAAVAGVAAAAAPPPDPAGFAAPPPNRSHSSNVAAAVASVAAAASAAAPEPDGNEDPLLKNFLSHLLDFCPDGVNNNSKGSNDKLSAIDVDKARNILEACAGNVALAGQLYWDDYFATQQHQQRPQQQQPQPQADANFSPLDAPSDDAVASAGAEDDTFDPEEEGRRIRRRLENDFERMFPGAAALESRHSRRRRRRRRQENAADDTNNNDDRGRRNAEAQPAGEVNAEEPADEQPQQPEAAADNRQDVFDAVQAVFGAGEDAAEGSVSVSDDENGVARVLRMVNESGRHMFRNRGRRRRRSSSNDDNNIELIRAREMMIGAQLGYIETVEQETNNKRKRSTKDTKKSNLGAGGDDHGDSSSNDGSDGESDDDAYLSENDWILKSAPSPKRHGPPGSSTAQTSQNLRAPIGVLWKGLKPIANDDAKAVSLKKSKETAEDAAKGEQPSQVNDTKHKATYVNNDEAIENDADDRANNAKATRPEIPSTWLHASFSPHKSGMGLALKNPKPENIAENSWRLQQGGRDRSSPQRRNSSLPMPYHCRSVSAILSIVNAMIYTGASIQSNEVTCSTSRKHFLELSEDDRNREFESRLIDALSALVFIAARSSMARKKKALTKKLDKKNRKMKRLKKKKEDELYGNDDEVEEPDLLQLTYERKLKLCQVAWWKETTQGEPLQPADQWQTALDDSARSPWIQIASSYSNIADIRAFVLSNMRSFSAPGGLALLLETIVGIHGEGAVTRMLKKSRAVAMMNNENQVDSCKHSFLVRCTCEERQRNRLQDSSLSAAEKRKLTSSLDTTPPGNQCISVELISLLLTGKVHSSWSGWSTGELGFGFLSMEAGDVGRSLARPEKPVWVLKGETCFSLLCLDHTNHGENLDEHTAPASSPPKGGKKGETKKPSSSPRQPKAAPCMRISSCSDTSRIRDLTEAQEFARMDLPGAIANMIHWNSWFGVRNLSGMRLIADRPQWSAPKPSKILESYKEAPTAQHSLSLSCQRKSVRQQLLERRQSAANIVSADEREITETIDVSRYEKALERARFHPDDASFYPKQYRMWRFDMGEAESDLDPNSKPRGDHWKPYHGLSREEQNIVEMKFGPQINRILWTRWPGATVDKFTPQGKNDLLPVV